MPSSSNLAQISAMAFHIDLAIKGAEETIRETGVAYVACQVLMTWQGCAVVTTGPPRSDGQYGNSNEAPEEYDSRVHRVAG
jgi:hypothetical protein